MTKVEVSSIQSKENPHLEAISNPVDALEFLEAVNFALLNIDVTWQYGPKVQEAISRLLQLQTFFFKIYSDDVERRISNCNLDRL